MYEPLIISLSFGKCFVVIVEKFRLTFIENNSYTFLANYKKNALCTIVVESVGNIFTYG